uniref:hypothetical protein n=1 Tax=Bacillus cytotoxicus TaxID=580165 RepID=UPI002041B2BD
MRYLKPREQASVKQFVLLHRNDLYICIVMKEERGYKKEKCKKRLQKIRFYE